jgi:TolB-like protein/Flp pilus assembly protein TadD
VTDGPQDGEGSSIRDRLRRRKVVQWGLAYAAGAWALLQGLQFAAEAFEWPSRVRRLGTVAALSGLPLAVVLAWFHGDRGHQKVTGAELAILIVLLCAGGGTYWRVASAPEASIPAAAASRETTAALAADKSIAVLPFADLSQAKDQEYFSDGLAEEVLDQLAKVPGLRVIARTSSFSFRGKDADAGTIAARLHVSHLLQGSVRKEGQRLRVSVQLVRASDSSQRWSETFDRTLDDVFKVQAEIAQSVARQLSVELLSSTRGTPEIDASAYAAYLQARYLSRRQSKENFAQAVALYKKALEIAPGYAPAWSGLAKVYVSEADKAMVPAAEGTRLARAALAQAIAIDPNLADAHAALGLIAMNYDGDLTAAARHLQRAIELDPLNPGINADAGLLAGAIGRLELASTLFAFAAARDPLLPGAQFNQGQCSLYGRRYDAAAATIRTTLELVPEATGVHFLLGITLMRQGENDAALAELAKEPGEAWRLVGESIVYSRLKKRAESDAALQTLISKFGTDWPYNIASVYAFRGEADRAFEWLEKAVEAKDTGLREVGIETLFESLHSDPRWPSFLRTRGMAPEQLAAIKFAVTPPR